MQGQLNMKEHTITNISAPMNPTDAVNKRYVDAQAKSLTKQFSQLGKQVSENNGKIKTVVTTISTRMFDKKFIQELRLHIEQIEKNLQTAY